MTKSSPSLSNEFRDQSVSARLVDTIVQDLGMCCPIQEIFDWDDTQRMSDCFTVVTWPDSNVGGKHRKFINYDFARERRYLGRLEKQYHGMIRKPGEPGS